MGEADLMVQYYLATDASKWYLEGVLFQLIDSSPGIKAMHSYKKKHMHDYVHDFLVGGCRNPV